MAFTVRNIAAADTVGVHGEMKGAARRIAVFGVVQGVGFRPFIHRLARRFHFHGWVKNRGSGVEIHIEGPGAPRFDPFLEALRKRRPPLAVIESVDVRPVRFQGFSDFRVEASERGPTFVFIAPDIAACPACLREIADPDDRRYRYPFANCTDCGPRYTIVSRLPYDRPATTMAGFPMCPDCAAEYENPADRRYHAQPIACPVCGPQVKLRTGKRAVDGGPALEAAVESLRRGRIVAVKGLGGFHLVCDPLNARAVARLRKIKERQRKPLALMARDMDVIRRFAHVSRAEERLLRAPGRPIVLLKKKKDIPGIAPHLDEIGFVLAYTPLHVLLLEKPGLVVATSSNPKDAPIIKEEDEGIEALCDDILGHNRPIHMRADDSVIRASRGGPLFVRRARGFVPAPLKTPPGLAAPGHILALGAELKATVTVAKNGYAITSQFLGDLDEYRNHRYFEETVKHLERLFEVSPAAVVSDLHPDFHTTRWAERLAQRAAIPHVRVQHHHAHILAVLLEHGLAPDSRVLGVAWDGYGYGSDGTAWGAEFLAAGYHDFVRYAHFEPVPLPGGDLAAREPWRMALAYLRRAGFAAPPALPSLRPVPRPRRDRVWVILENPKISPPAASAGRLFDAVSAIIGTSPPQNEFEAEAAMRLEAAAARGRTGLRYPYDILPGAPPLRIGFAPMILAILSDLKKSRPRPEIAARFHNTLARIIVDTSRRARSDLGLETIVLCGGVFLNKVLMEKTAEGLKREGFKVLRPLRYSPNDEAISLGQAGYGLAKLNAAISGAG